MSAIKENKNYLDLLEDKFECCYWLKKYNRKVENFDNLLIKEDYIVCYRLEDNKDVLAKKYLYKEYKLSFKEAYNKITFKAIGQLIRGEIRKCDEGWCLFTVRPGGLITPFGKK